MEFSVAMHDASLTPQRIDHLLSALESTTMIVAGDTMIDEYFWGDVQRISPEAPVPVVEVESVSRRLGGAANVVQNLARLGVHAQLISLCGDDANGTELARMLDGIGCGTGGLFRSTTRPTTIKTRIIARHQQVVRADREMIRDCDDIESSELLEGFNTYIADSDGVILSDYGKGVVSPLLISSIVDACITRKKFVAIDPKDRHIHLYKNVSVITPNLKEAHILAGVPFRHCSDEEIKNLGWHIVESYNLQYLLVTLSERGMALFSAADHLFIHLPTVAQKVFDVTGAGDTVITVFTALMAAGAEPYEAAFIANHAAGITVAQLGTVSVSPQELRDACLK